MRDVSIAFVGDIFMGEKPQMSLEPGVAEVLGRPDLVVANQEGPVTAVADPVLEKTCLKSSPASASILRDWGVDVVTLANNHMFDYGWEGFTETRRALAQADIAYLGAGHNLSEATKPLVRDINGFRLGLLNYSCEATETTCAGEKTFGCAPVDAALMIAQIKDLSGIVDAVVVLPHWGYYDFASPTLEQVNLANRLLDAGATAVVGHHSHVINGVVKRGDQLVAYSLGNFAFAPFKVDGRVMELSQENHEGTILMLHFAGRTLASYEAILTVERNDHIALDDTAPRRMELAKQSKLLASPDYARYWRRVVRRRLIKRILYWADVRNWRRIRKATLYTGWLLLKHMVLRR